MNFHQFQCVFESAKAVFPFFKIYLIIMINSIESYTEAGVKSAKARNQRDEACSDFHRRWFSQAVALESEEDRVIARKAYDDGYASARNVPTPAYFR